MALLNYSHDPNNVYRYALGKAGNGQDIYVYERDYNGHDLWYEVHDDTLTADTFKDTNQYFLEMHIPAFDVAGELTTQVRRTINKVFRRIDESDLWPVCGAYDATNRAIRRLKRWEKMGSLQTIVLSMLHIPSNCSKILKAVIFCSTVQTRLSNVAVHHKRFSI